MKEGLIKDTYELILKEIQTIIMLSYIIIVGIGMLFTYMKYSEFGINIFDYADIFDFLIAPFSDPRIVLFSIASTLFVFILSKFQILYQRKLPKLYSKVNFGLDKKSWFNTFKYILFTILALFYLFVSSLFYGELSKEQTLQSPQLSLTYSDNQSIKGQMIGKTANIIFLLQGEKVKAIPLNSLVKEFDVK